ncbi:MAG: hypothetical protein WCD31_08830 [Gillisia sp.]
MSSIPGILYWENIAKGKPNITELTFQGENVIYSKDSGQYIAIQSNLISLPSKSPFLILNARFHVELLCSPAGGGDAYYVPFFKEGSYVWIKPNVTVDSQYQLESEGGANVDPVSISSGGQYFYPEGENFFLWPITSFKAYFLIPLDFFRDYIKDGDDVSSYVVLDLSILSLY